MTSATSSSDAVGSFLLEMTQERGARSELAVRSFLEELVGERVVSELRIEQVSCDVVPRGALLRNLLGRGSGVAVPGSDLSYHGNDSLHGFAVSDARGRFCLAFEVSAGSDTVTLGVARGERRGRFARPVTLTSEEVRARLLT